MPGSYLIAGNEGRTQRDYGLGKGLHPSRYAHDRDHEQERERGGDDVPAPREPHADTASAAAVVSSAWSSSARVRTLITVCASCRDM